MPETKPTNFTKISIYQFLEEPSLIDYPYILMHILSTIRSDHLDLLRSLHHIPKTRVSDFIWLSHLDCIMDILAAPVEKDVKPQKLNSKKLTFQS